MSFVANSNHPTAKALRHRRKPRGWVVVVISIALMLVPLAATIVLAPQVSAQSTTEAQPGKVNPRSEYWRAVRESAHGYTASSGPYTTDVLIQNGGENWRELRQGPVADAGALILAVTVIALLALYVIAGPDKVDERDGLVVLRWSISDRFLHWLMAGLFIILALTGLTLLYGRAALIPVMGKEAFSTLADVSMQTHNFLSLIFVVSLVVVLLRWLRFNLPSKTDLQWFKAAVTGKHKRAGFINGGEKAWYWVLTIFGIMLMVSGFFLLFPNLGWSRETMQLAHLFHVTGAIVTIAGSIGHIYMGLFHVPGSLETMTHGYADTAWMKHHHDLWYEEVKEQARPVSEVPTAHKGGKEIPT